MSNITTRLIEIRDNATCIPALVIYTHPTDEPHGPAWVVRRGGGGQLGVLLVRLVDGKGCSDPYDWGDRTHQAAHEWLCVCRQGGAAAHVSGSVDSRGMWLDGYVLDVRVYLDEAEEPVRSDSYSHLGPIE